VFVHIRNAEGIAQVKGGEISIERGLDDMAYSEISEQAYRNGIS